MKLKYLFGLIALVPAVFMASCSAEEGTEPGNDSNPVVTMYSYTAPEGYNPDQTAYVRVVPNNKVSKIYVLTELKADKEAFVAQSGAEAYVQRVVSQGTAYAAETQELVIEDLQGAYTITAVAEAANGARTAAEVNYKGIKWVEAGPAWVQENIAGLRGYVNVMRHDDENVFRVVGLYTQLDPDLGDPEETFDFVFNGENLVEFNNSNAPFVIVGVGERNGTAGDWHGYYNIGSYASYCYPETLYDGDYPVAVAHMLVLNNATGSLYTNGYIYMWMDEVEWVD